MFKPIPANKIPDDDEIWEYSNPKTVYRKGLKLNLMVLRSDKPNKKYMILTEEGKKIHFGLMDYEDYTKHNDEKRRDRFLKRSAHWKGLNELTPAYLSRELLW